MEDDQPQPRGKGSFPPPLRVDSGHQKNEPSVEGRSDLAHACPSHAQCPTCHGPVYFLADLPDGQLPLPVEPLYELAVAAVLIPCSLNTLKFKLHKHKDVFEPPYYRLDSEHRRHRMISASQVCWLREKMIRRATRRPGFTRRRPRNVT
jgi:hypothetical protein